MPWAAAAAIGGALISSSSSKKASKAQQRSADAASQAQLTAARESNALQEKIYNQNRADALPWKNVGEGALNQLAWKMGITPVGATQSGINGAGKTRQDFYNELLGSGKYTTQAASSYSLPQPLIDYIRASDIAKGEANGGTFDSLGEIVGGTVDSATGLRWGGTVNYTPGTNSTANSATDYAALNSEADRLFAEQSAKANQAGYQGSPSDFGSLSRNFTMADRDADPVYQSGLQFGLAQGVQGLERQAAASGSQLSGATLKALARYGNDYGTTKAQGAYERFNNNQTTQYNRLAGISGTGQQQVNQIGAAGQSYANSVGANTMNTANNIANNTIGAGNARAGSYMATANSFNNAIGTGINAWQQNKYLNNMNNLYTGSGTQAPAPVEYR